MEEDRGVASGLLAALVGGALVIAAFAWLFTTLGSSGTTTTVTQTVAAAAPATSAAAASTDAAATTAEATTAEAATTEASADVGVDPSTLPEEVVFGARAYTQYGCSACHGIDGKGGVSPQVPGITAAAPDPAADIKKVIENGIGVSADAQAPFMPSWNRIIPDAQIDGLVAYIQAGVPVVLGIDQERPGPTLSPKTAGAMLYVADGCQNCHGVNGLGGVPNKGSADGSIPPVAGADFASEFDTPAKIRDMIVNGSVVAKPPVAAMPRWGGVLTDSEIDALVAYIQSLTPAK